ncbi:MAG: DUF1257 domain-containing protein [Pirellulaceae bacterium]
MSHIVTIQTQIRDPIAIRFACNRLSLPEPNHREVKLFSTSAIGWAVELPQWRYPVVCDTANAVVSFDNYGGRWGEPKHLDRFLQAYAVEKATLEARKQGHSVSEQTLDDGSIKLSIVTGGAA